MIRLATSRDLHAFATIERAAGLAFNAIGMPEIAADDPLSIDEYSTYQRQGRAWVWTDDLDQPQAYLLAKVLADSVHIEQVSIHPAISGQGRGRGLIDHLNPWALDQGRSQLTLTTFAEVPWNAPYYRRIGFAEVPPEDWTLELQAIIDHEIAVGLHRWPRVIMSRRTD